MSDEKEFLKEKQSLIHQQNKALKRALKGLEKLKSDLAESRDWEKVHHEGVLLQANQYQLYKGMSHIFVEDWESGTSRKILLDKRLEPKIQIEKIFKKAKKLKKASVPLEKAIVKGEEFIGKLEKKIEDLEKVETFSELEAYKTKPLKKGEEEKILPYKMYTTETGLPIWVGKSAKKNDEMTFSYARGSDWWLHAKDYPGSHVILKVTKNKEPDGESLQDAIQMAIGHSKAKEQGYAEVVVTQCKFVSKMGQTSGKVQISKHKTVAAKFNQERFDRIRKRESA